MTIYIYNIYRHRYMVMVSIDQQTHQEAGKLAVTATEMLSSMEVTASFVRCAWRLMKP